MKRLLRLFLLLFVAACNDRTLPTAEDIVAQITTIEIEPNPIRVEEGDFVSLRVIAHDAAGQVVERPLQPVWRSSDAEIAEVSLAGRLTAHSPGAVIVTAETAGYEAYAPVAVLPKTAASILIHPTQVRLTTAQDTVLRAIVRDSSGTALSSRGIRWSSDEPATATVDSTGRVNPHRAGTVTITARRGTVAGRATLIIDWGAPADVQLSPADTTIVIGENLQLTATVRDARGNVLEDARINWESLDPAVALVSSEGIARGVAEGSTRIRASIGQAHAEVLLHVATPSGVVIHSIAPNPLLQRRTAVVEGFGFAPDITRNIVTINDLVAPVRMATDRRIEFDVPDFGLGQCDDPLPAILRIRAETDEGVAVGQIETGVVSGEHLRLQPGEARIVGNIECVVLDAEAGTYILTVYNATATPSALAAFRITGNGGGSAATIPSLPYDAVAGGASFESARLHAQILEENRRIATLPRVVRQGKTTAAGGPIRTPSVGDQVVIRIPRLTNLCQTYATVDSRVVYSGARAIVLEDPTNPGAGQMDEIYQALGREFDQVMWDILLANFGDPLAYDAHLNADGRIYMLFSNRVREQSSAVAGFVTSADFASRTVCPSSNEAEIFYAIAPTSLSNAAAWQRSTRSTIIHEVKHLVSYAERYAAGTPLEERWLEEGTAMIAMELWARTIFGFRQFGNTLFQESIGCELQGGASGLCADAPVVMYDHFYWLAQYYGDIEQKTPLGFQADSDPSFYGSGWQFVRWAIDTYASSESAFLRALTRSGTTGIANLSARTGHSLSQMLPSFALAMAGDDYPGGVVPRDPAHSLQSWNTRDIFRGLHSASATTFPVQWPLAARTTTLGRFTVDVPALRGGSAMILELSGSQAVRQTLRFSSAAGAGPMPVALGVAILRVR